MPSIFPQLFDYSFFAPFILRIGLAIVLLQIGYLGLKETGKCSRACGAIQMIGAIFLAVGFLTQIAALLIIITVLGEAIYAKIKKTSANRQLLKFLVLAVALSLMLLGPGAFSIDLPL